MTQDQHQELAHLRAEVDRLQAEVSRGITALADCIGERDKAYKAGMLRAADLLAGNHRDSTIDRIRLQYKRAIEVEAQKGQP